jgi:hypothetical protein
MKANPISLTEWLLSMETIAKMAKNIVEIFKSSKVEIKTQTINSTL